jgi:dTDP-glucose 4,6-dehydratase
MRVLVTGGNGFLGTHLCTALLDRGDEVVSLDNFATSEHSTLDSLRNRPGFTFVEADVCNFLADETLHASPVLLDGFDGIVHLACPASPPDYLRLPIETLAIGSHGSESVLTLARRCDCRVLLASTSEIYGEPLVRPQPESYFGNVNPVGPRSVYDESKRYAEAMFAAYRRTLGTDSAIVRIFNTYGPGLRPHDGRVVSNFVAQALAGEPLTIYGDGTQSRSFCYVSDLVAGLLAMLDADVPGPVNLGNPHEVSVGELARRILALTGSSSPIVHMARPVDDPTTRRPDISAASTLLGWQPGVPLEEGLVRTIEWQRSLAVAA